MKKLKNIALALWFLSGISFAQDELFNIPDNVYEMAQAHISELEDAETDVAKENLLLKLRMEQEFVLINGAKHYQTKDFHSAWQHYEMVITIHDLLKNAEPGSILSSNKRYLDHVLVTAQFAYATEELNRAKSLYEFLNQHDQKKSTVLNNLFKLNKDTRLDLALEYLKEGRRLFPNDEELKVTESNYHLEIDQLDVQVID